MNKLTNRHRKENATAQMAHLVLPETQADPSQNQKSHFFANARQNVDFLILKP